ncbi:unnamed protein product [Penicillium bialowiezense]
MRLSSLAPAPQPTKDHSSRLSPHEADDLDVILLGHSIGGALAAGVTLLPGLPDTRHLSKKHRILGLVNFDVPFLGLHPCVISSGIRSLFRKSDIVNAVVPGENRGLEEMDASYFPIVTNPNFDPCFGNDVRLPEHSRLQGAIDFFDKNIHHLPRSIFDSVISFYKFPGYLNRLPHLRRQYQEMMTLEAATSGGDRVRFVNYYTESNGQKTTTEDRTHKHGCDNCHKDNVDDSYKASSESVRSTSIGTRENSMEHAATTRLSDSGEKYRPEVKVDKRELRTFVLKPSHHWKDGDNDLWNPVQMNGMDEVEAHQSMFLPDGSEYEKVVGDTVSTIEHWVQDAMSARVIGMEKTTSSR